MKALILLLISACASILAQSPGWQPSPGHTQVPIWPETPPDAQSTTGAEAFATVNSSVAGRPWVKVSNVSRPTMTVYSPKGKNRGAAIIVFPGGGYQILAIDLEGTEVCDELTSRGITCVLLKYRVPNTGPHWEEGCDCQVNPKAPMALEDAQRTLGLVRFSRSAVSHRSAQDRRAWILSRRAPGNGHQHAFRQAFVSGGGCG